MTTSAVSVAVPPEPQEAKHSPTRCAKKKLSRLTKVLLILGLTVLIAVPLLILTAFREGGGGGGRGSAASSMEPVDCSGASETLYVSPTGDDHTNSGAEASPLQTIHACVSMLNASLGGACLLFPGSYHEPEALVSEVPCLTIASAHSEPSVPADGSVVIDGTISLNDLAWDAMTDAAGVSYYRSAAAVSTEVWQIFVNGEPLTSARWPNAPAWSDASWNRELGWARSTSGTDCGRTVDPSLARADVSFAGCTLVINNEHWITRQYTVEQHAQGQDSLSYSPVGDDRRLCDKYSGDEHARYFIAGCAAALDAPGEFAFDAAGRLLVYPPATLLGVPVSEWDIRGKAQTYGLAFSDCPGLTVRGLTFFATTLFVSTSHGAVIRDNGFQYPSASRRALGAHAAEFDVVEAFGVSSRAVRPKWAAGSTYAWVPTTKLSGNGVDESRYTFANNIVNRSEGSGVLLTFTGSDLIENNHLEDVGYPFGRSIELYSFLGGQRVRRNTLIRDGAGGIGLLWGADAVAELNDVSRSGLLVTDSQGIGGGKPSKYDTIQLNWVHHSRGLGIRFDAGEDGQFPEGCRIISNVAFANGQGGISTKSNRGRYLRNTALANQLGDDPEVGAFGSSPDLKIAACYPASCVASDGGGATTNVGSITAGNVGLMSAGGRGLSLPGTLEDNIDLGAEPFAHLRPDDLVRDFANRDFRPRPGGALIGSGVTLAGRGLGNTSDASAGSSGHSMDAGAYDVGVTTYWIPGRQAAGASSPVPPDGATSVRPSASLIFLGGNRSDGGATATAPSHHTVHVGEEGAPLATNSSANCSSCAQVASLSAPSNVYTPVDAFVPGRAYLWRVDAVYADGATVVGETYRFEVGCEDVGCDSCGNSTSAASCTACRDGLSLVGGRCVQPGGCASGYWSLTAVPTNYGDPKTAVTAAASSSFSDAFEVVAVAEAGSGCAGNGLESLYVVNTADNSSVVTLSCNNQGWGLTAAWTCTVCAAGFAQDPGVPSGCTLVP
jgi:hypothetical protein